MEFSFTSTDVDDSLHQIAVWLGNKPKDNVIAFDEFVGKGIANIAPLETGLFVRVWDFVLKDDVSFHMLPSAPELSLNFIANYILTPDSYHFPSLEYKDIQRSSNNLTLLLLANSQSDLRYTVYKGNPVKSFEICFTAEWLASQILNHDIQKAKKLIAEKTSPPQLTNNISLQDYMVADELQHRIFDGTLDKIYLRSKLLLLINSLLQHYLLGEKPVEPVLNRYAAILAKVEQYLVESLYGKLPELEELAKKFSMSQSTLKRQFRALYGENIYEYYLQKKMELASQLLTEGRLSISEIAFKLGYEKLSSFSSIFKKHFGKTPAAFSEEHSSKRSR